MNTTPAHDLAQYFGLRVGRDISHEEIAEVLGVTRQSYRNWRKDGKLNASHVIVLAEHYGVNSVQAQVDNDLLPREAALEYLEGVMPGFTALASRRKAPNRSNLAEKILNRNGINPELGYLL